MAAHQELRPWQPGLKHGAGEVERAERSLGLGWPGRLLENRLVEDCLLKDCLLEDCLLGERLLGEGLLQERLLEERLLEEREEVWEREAAG
jgi:hypothetical protein